ncbi:hypothetical protein FHG87_016319 [Trinorchestia longiramus]|nr:hypothetical protein FHG87_016319 [Trinorchestia longiramus]
MGGGGQEVLRVAGVSRLRATTSGGRLTVSSVTDTHRYREREKKWRYMVDYIGADLFVIKLGGGSMRLGIPPSIFNVPASCLPSPKPAPRPAKLKDQQLRYLLQKDKITSFDAFKPEPGRSGRRRVLRRQSLSMGHLRHSPLELSVRCLGFRLKRFRWWKTDIPALDLRDRRTSSVGVSGGSHITRCLKCTVEQTRLPSPASTLRQPTTQHTRTIQGWAHTILLKLVMASKLIVTALLLIQVAVQVSALDEYTQQYFPTTALFKDCEEKLHKIKGEPYHIKTPGQRNFIRFAPARRKFIKWTELPMRNPKSLFKCLHFEENLYKNSTMIQYRNERCYRTTDTPYVVDVDEENCRDNPPEVVYIAS